MTKERRSDPASPSSRPPRSSPPSSGYLPRATGRERPASLPPFFPAPPPAIGSPLGAGGAAYGREPAVAQRHDANRARHDESVATARQFIQSVAIPRLSLTVEREGGRPVTRTLIYDGDLCRIGSHPTNDVVLLDGAVSRFHCRLSREESGWRLYDWDSLNGTKLEGLRVRDADVPADAALALGDSMIRVRAVDPAEQALVPLPPAFGQLVGTSVRMRKLFGVLQKIAPSEINVLVQGESGTGKELVANEIVERSARAEKPFVVVDCGAISPSLIESELFGHVRGSFTGADRDRIGAFESADGGTVLLDEVGELPVELQPKMLRAIEAREIRRVGETKARKVNVRILSATHRQLEREVNRGRFREDLYFRLAVITVRVPPLRERLDDLLILVRMFLNALGVPEQERLFTAPVLAEMERHDWPGNVRELRNYVERSVVMQKASPTSKSTSLAAGARPIDVSVPFRLAKDAAVDEFERAYLCDLLAAAGHNMSKAARMACMDRMYLHRLTQKHGLRGGGGVSS